MDVIAPPNVGRERVKMRARKRSGGLPFFRADRRYADEWTVEWSEEAFLPTTDWNSRTEQSERPERDR